MANFLRPLVFFFSMMIFLIEFNSESALSAGGQVNDLHDRKFVHRERGKGTSDIKQTNSSIIVNIVIEIELKYHLVENRS